MAIGVACSCGHSARVEEALAGRWVRCAACGKLLSVSRRDSRDPAPTAPGAKPPPIPGQVSATRANPVDLIRGVVSGVPTRAWGQAIRRRAGWIVVIAVNLAIVAGAGIYWVRGWSGMGDRATGPMPIAAPSAVPAPGGDGALAPPGGAEKAIAAVPLSTREVVARCEESVAQINGRFGSGSGFLVRPGLLATNAHVVRGELVGDVRVHFPSGEGHRKGPHRASLIYEDIPRDIALLTLEVTFPPLPLASPYTFRRGEDVTIIGSPGVGFAGVVLQNAVSRGVLSTETVLLGQKYYQLGASVNHGNSGGPAIDSKGEVVGVVTLKAGEESIGFCIPVDDLAGAIERARPATAEASRSLAGRHDASAACRSLIVRGSLSAVAIAIHAKRIDAILQRREDAGDLDEALDGARARLAERNQSFDDGYRVAVSDLLAESALPADLRRDLRALWSVCDDMSRLALDPRPDLRRFGDDADSLASRFTGLVRGLGRDLGIDLP